MRLRYRLLSIILVLTMCISCMVYAKGHLRRTQMGTQADLQGDEGALSALGDVLSDTTTLRLWYTDASLTEYLNSMAAAWHDSASGRRLIIEQVSAIDYLEAIQRASVDEDVPTPDLYLTTHDSLEKAYLAGLASEVTSDPGLLFKFAPEAARQSVSYSGRRIAYPYYFETAALLYNRTYLEAAARDVLEDEALQAGEALVGTEVPLEEAAVQKRLESYLPQTIADIMSFADAYNAPEEVEAVFEWDVNDVFNNYFFVGAYLNVGGEDGDDIARIDIYNTDAIRGLRVFQRLNQFFAIDAAESSADQVIEDLIAGRTVFTIATTDAVRRIEEARQQGRCSFTFGAAPMPDLTPDLKGRAMSVTTCLVVNGYGAHTNQAHELAQFLCTQAYGSAQDGEEASDAMSRMSGKCAAGEEAVYANELYDAFYEVYEGSAPMSKMIEMSNFWVHLEIAFTDVWNGADANDTLRALFARMMTQLTGSEYQVEHLPDPPEDALEEDDTDAGMD